MGRRAAGAAPGGPGRRARAPRFRTGRPSPRLTTWKPATWRLATWRLAIVQASRQIERPIEGPRIDGGRSGRSGGRRVISDDRRKWWVLGAMGAILGVILLDETVVGVALPTIQIDLSMSEIDSHWVVNVYMLVLAGLAAAAGKLGDIVGHKALVTCGLALFGLSSLACGFADSGVWLIAARGFQGVGAAVIFPSSLAMVTMAFPENQRGLALGIYGAIGTVFLALGPFVGGLLTDVASWRWIFWINPPVVLAVALIVLAAWIEPPRAGARQRVDRTGLVLLVAGLSMVVFATMEGPEASWGDPIILTLLLTGLALLAGFVFVELGKPAPLIEVDLFANATFAGCNLVIFAAQFTKMAERHIARSVVRSVLEIRLPVYPGRTASGEFNQRVT